MVARFDSARHNPFFDVTQPDPHRNYEFAWRPRSAAVARFIRPPTFFDFTRPEILTATVTSPGGPDQRRWPGSNPPAKPWLSFGLILTAIVS